MPKPPLISETYPSNLKARLVLFDTTIPFPTSTIPPSVTARTLHSTSIVIVRRFDCGARAATVPLARHRLDLDFNGSLLPSFYFLHGILLQHRFDIESTQKKATAITTMNATARVSGADWGCFSWELGLCTFSLSDDDSATKKGPKDLVVEALYGAPNFLDYLSWAYASLSYCKHERHRSRRSVNEANWHPTSRVVAVGAGCGISSALIGGLFMHLFHWFRSRTDRNPPRTTTLTTISSNNSNSNSTNTKMNGTGAGVLTCVNDKNLHSTEVVLGAGLGCGVGMLLLGAFLAHVFWLWRSSHERKNSIPTMELKNLDVEDLNRARKMLNLPVEALDPLDEAANKRLDKKAEKEKEYLEALENRNKMQGELIKEQVDYIKLLKDEIEHYKNA
ncbi:uncharacterized protein BO66DRAFT_443793 [Aspergillus aculeatinus CBS 121060]|uniref:Uncharacterized protein n=1 Tax=Aspergillus aculeatinus CBS 121060 TaxID=1448322 RepID=A0ACD1GT37_9EURO|nr:hypothetical protein BO66DRAFT_443793 [Aspergillus aculeatinus CBS 121060]RAH64617.1 hypothetical protein BO66DRAFT_443793 [Aspergillus aculeatinus CBS 121060]